MSYLLDTSVVSEIWRRAHDPRALGCFDSVDPCGDRIVGVSADVADLWGRLNVPDRLLNPFEVAG